MSADKNYIDIVFDGPPGHESGRFVEVEDANGHSFNAGDWIDRGDGLWALRLWVDASNRLQTPVTAKLQRDAIIEECAKVVEEHYPAGAANTFGRKLADVLRTHKASHKAEEAEFFGIQSAELQREANRIVCPYCNPVKP